MLRHRWHTSVLPTLLLSLQILIVHLLLIIVVTWIDLIRSRHALLLWRKVADVFWGIRYIGVVNTIRIRCWLWGV